MSCLSSARYGFLLAGLISTGLWGAPLSPADQNAIELQQEATVFNYIERDYNRWRRHSACGGLSPEQFENKSLA